MRGGVRRSKWLLVLSFAVLSSILAWACGGGGGEKPTATTAPAATGPAGKTPEAQGGGGQFSDLAAVFSKATFKVTYQESGGTAQGFSGTMTLYKKGDNAREDLDGTDSSGQQMNATLIIGTDQTYFCGEIPGIAESGACYSTPTQPGQGPADIIAGLETTLTDPSANVVPTSSRNIAGEDAKCYTVSSPDIEGEFDICLSSEGVPLYTRDTAAGVETSMEEATAFSRDVSDSDFEPLYPVRAMPSGAGNP
jgi:hypothetical protein